MCATEVGEDDERKGERREHIARTAELRSRRGLLFATLVVAGFGMCGCGAWMLYILASPSIGLGPLAHWPRDEFTGLWLDLRCVAFGMIATGISVILGSCVWCRRGEPTRRGSETRLALIFAPFGLLLASGLLLSGPLRGAETDKGLRHLNIRIDDPAPEVQRSASEFLSVLKAIDPRRDGGGVRIENGYYILFGRLFGGDVEYALIARGLVDEDGGALPAAGTAFASWGKNGWKIRAMWKVDPIWTVNADGADAHAYPIQPSRAPFWTEELSGDKVPEVVLVGGVDKYWQEHFVLKLDSSGDLKLCADAMKRPYFSNGLLRLSFNSGRRAIWGREDFYRWKGDTLVQRATWHDESPYNNVDNPFTVITRHSEAGKVEGSWRVEMTEGGERVDTYEIFDGRIDERNEEATEAGKARQKRQRLAAVSFVWPPSKDGQPNQDALGQESRYFWERLSGLPWSALKEVLDVAETGALPKNVAVRVSGDAHLVRLLQQEPQGRK